VHYTSQTGEVRADGVLVSVLARRLGLVQVVVVLVVGMGSLQVVSLLGIPPPIVLNTGMGGVVALRWRGGMVHGLRFMVLVLLQLERVGSLVVVIVVVFVEVALIGEMLWIVLTLLWSKWLGTGFTLLVLTPVLSCLFTHVLTFEFQAGDLRNVWLIDSDCSMHMTEDKGWFSSLVPVVSVGEIRNQAFRTLKIKECFSRSDSCVKVLVAKPQEPLNPFSFFRIRLSA
jgi:hypothetical protein